MNEIWGSVAKSETDQKCDYTLNVGDPKTPILMYIV